MKSVTNLIQAIFERVGLMSIPNDLKYLLFGIFMSIPFAFIQRIFCKKKKKRGIDDDTDSDHDKKD